MISEGTILLVDDQPEQIDVIKAALGRHFMVKVAIRGELVLPIARAGGVDLILLDVVMPGMDGYEVCRRLKEDPATRDIPVIFLTSKEGQEDEAIGLDLGAVDYIRKPSSPSVVRTRCRNTIAHRRAREALRQKNEELQLALRIHEDVERISRHDLKAPLSGILGIPELLLGDDNLTREQQHLLRLMEMSGYQMLEMINRSLDLFKMENGTYLFRPERFDVLDLLRRIVGDLARHADPKGLRISIVMEDDAGQSDPFFIVGEKMLCYSLFSNLLMNAIEASELQRAITIHLTARSGRGMIRITNAGEVPPAIRERFFEKYVTFGKSHGTGLGTYSAWLAARTQMGDIELDTSQPGLTSLLVTLPLP